MFIQPIVNRFSVLNSLYIRPTVKQRENNDCNVISFHGSTSAGQPLRRLRNVPCAFFDIITINSSDIEKIKKEISKKNTVKQSVQYLRKYKHNMLPTELAIFERFETSAKDSPRMKFPDLLKKWYPEALIKLKLEEFNVLDDIDRIASKLSPDTNFAVRNEITNCRVLLRDNQPDKPFKRKTVLNALDRINPQPGEENIMAELMERANYLPTSATSENAFIVKYANRSHNEISDRLIISSVATIDHLLAASKGGENDIGNFILTSAGANNLKQDMPLKKFIKRFPQVIENCQKYIDFIIDIINRGGLKGNQSYPYKIKTTLARESNNKIKLDLSNFIYSKAEAKELEKAQKK